ncbi:MAG: Rrf2 family transcriptional regulator nitric oxide-sensitive transcriptional repressor [Gammaproteobacteria bacterium]|nr:MAG: Rrf2 family transcriptional regulator nitric oxide-sensitive transcriptional repressor [Gammaproteobacteria bacterium]TND04996.1 MAG: Rrf2 family transcriptional regulator, nitric oxide-sensitive transcriptional repressor [Gammaproteobacteria bacterium]
MFYWGNAVQLTLYTDYSLRVLIFLGAHPDQLVTITEIADSYGISRNHLVKVVHNLATQGFVQTTRGKGGGMRLGKAPEDINLGELVRLTEGGFHLVECLNKTKNTCPITPACALKGFVSEALDAFIAVLDKYTLADVVRNRHQLSSILRLHPVRPTRPARRS